MTAFALPVSGAPGWAKRDAARRAGLAWLVLGVGIAGAALAGCANEPAPGSTSGIQAAAPGLAASVPSPEPATVDSDPRIVIETGRHSSIVRRLDVSIERNLVVTASDDKTARLWDLRQRTPRLVLRPPVGHGEAGRLYGAAIHPTEALVAVGGSVATPSGSRLLLLYSSDTGQLIRSIDSRGGDVKHLGWSRDGSLLLAAFAGTPAVRAFGLDGRLRYEAPLPDAAFGLATSADGTVAVSSLDGSITLLKAANGKVDGVRTFRAPRPKPVGLAFSPDGRKLAIAFFLVEQSPVVVDVESGRVLTSLPRPRVEVGTQFSVAWSTDGSLLAVGGSGHTGSGGYPVAFHDAASGRWLAQQPVARNSILDLRAHDATAFAYASADGSWGIIDGRPGREARAAGPGEGQGAESLEIGRDGQSLVWNHDANRDPLLFSLQNRLVQTGHAATTRADVSPPSLRGRWRGSTWQNTVLPVLGGTAFPLGPGEISRALASLPSAGGAVLGTSHRLIGLAETGQPRWQLRTATEVRAVNVSADGRLAVVGLADGTVEWRRPGDGRLLATLLALRDGRWIVWTPEGYFDAAAGADRLAGWSVNRPDEAVADFFSLNRFRERFNRPDLIDRVIARGLPVAELGPIDPVRGQSGDEARANASGPAFPPVVELDGPTAGIAASELRIPVRLRAEHDPSIEVRIDGRPAQDVAITRAETSLSPTAKVTATATVTVPTPPAGAAVVILARDRNGVSEPLAIPAASKPGSPPLVALPVPLPAGVTPRPPSLSASGVTTGEIRRPGETATAPRPEPGGPRLFVLAIGVGAYRREAYQLDMPAKDASDFAAMMRRQGGTQYREVDIRILTDRDASREAILRQLDWLAGSVTRDDVGMLFIAGHGVNSARQEYFFLPYDGDHERIEETALSESALRGTLARMQGRALFFVDTCHGGNAVGTFSRASRDLARLANDLAAAENGVIVFASSSGRQLSEESAEWGNGAFTFALLSGLGGRADLSRSGRITYKALDYFVSEEVTRLTDGRQTPVTIVPVGVPDFAIARVAPI